MPASKKPQIIGSSSRSVSELLKSYTSKSKPATASVAKEDVAQISYNPRITISSISSSTSRHSQSKNTLKREHLSDFAVTNAYDIGETDYDYQDSSDSGSLEEVLDFPSKKFSIAHGTLCLKEKSRERKKQLSSTKSQVNHFRRQKTGMKEYKNLLSVFIETARETDDHEVQKHQTYKAYLLFNSMRKMGFPIDEEIYEPFLKYLTDEDMVQEFYFFSDIFKHGKHGSLPRLAYYEMMFCIRLNNKQKIKQLIYDYSLYDGEDKHLVQESYLLALCESDCRRELLMLLETFDVTKASSGERLSDMFKSLGMLSLEAYAQKFLLELKSSGAELETLSNYIYDYATNIPNSEVEDVGSKFKQLHSEMEMEPTSRQYEKLIRHYCKLLKVHVAIDLADEMFNMGSTTSLETIHTMLDACMQSYEYNMVHRIYSIIRRQGLKPNSKTFRSLISLIVRLKDFNGAYDMLREMAKANITPTIIIYNTIMAGCFREKDILGALAVLKQMEKEDLKPNSLTFSYLIRNCNSGEEIDKVLYEMKKSDVQVTKHVSMALINAFAACGEFEKAKQVILDGIPKKNLNEMRSVLVLALASHGQLSDALNIYDDIKQAGSSLQPKNALYLINHIQSEGQLDRLLQLQEELQDSDYFIDGCCRVVGYCVRHNHLSSAVELLKKIWDKVADDEVAAANIFDEVFFVFVNQDPKDMKFGLELLRAIKEEIGLLPSRNVLDFLLDACVSANDLTTAFFIWKEYQVAGLPYNILSFLRMYRTLSALGDLKSAEEIVKKIPQDDYHISYVIKGFRDTYLREKKKENDIEE